MKKVIVIAGPNDVPEPVIRRRFDAGRCNFERHYRSEVDDWALYDNAGADRMGREHMTPDELSKARNSDLRASLSALLRAAQSAREIAIQTRTAIVIMRNGRIVRVAADELAQQLNRGAS